LLWSDDATNHIVSFYARIFFTLKMAAIAAEKIW